MREKVYQPKVFLLYKKKTKKNPTNPMNQKIYVFDLSFTVPCVNLRCFRILAKGVYLHLTRWLIENLKMSFFFLSHYNPRLVFLTSAPASNIREKVYESTNSLDCDPTVPRNKNEMTGLTFEDPWVRRTDYKPELHLRKCDKHFRKFVCFVLFSVSVFIRLRLFFAFSLFL